MMGEGSTRAMRAAYAASQSIRPSSTTLVRHPRITCGPKAPYRVGALVSHASLCGLGILAVPFMPLAYVGDAAVANLGDLVGRLDRPADDVAQIDEGDRTVRPESLVRLSGEHIHEPGDPDEKSRLLARLRTAASAGDSLGSTQPQGRHQRPSSDRRTRSMFPSRSKIAASAPTFGVMYPAPRAGGAAPPAPEDPAPGRSIGSPAPSNRSYRSRSYAPVAKFSRCRRSSGARRAAARCPWKSGLRPGPDEGGMVPVRRRHERLLARRVQRPEPLCRRQHLRKTVTSPTLVSVVIGWDSTNATARSMVGWSVNGSYQVVCVLERSPHGSLATVLMIWTPTSFRRQWSSSASTSRRYWEFDHRTKLSGKHDGVEVEAAQGFQVGARGVVRVAGDAEPACDSGLAASIQRFQRPALRRALVQFVKLAHSVQLVEIEPIGSQPLQGPV